MLDAQPKPLNEDWVLLETFFNEVSAKLASIHLESEGIAAFIVPYRISVFDLGKFGLWVPKIQFEEAQTFLLENNGKTPE